MEPLALGQLAVWRHPAPRSPIARVLLIHGISEHSARHLNTIEALNQNGIEVFRFDLRGAGLSGGRRQWVARFSDYVADTAKVYNWISATFEPLPLFVLGHSLGGAIALTFASEYGSFFQGLIVSAPAFKTGSAIPGYKILVGRMLVRVVPTMRIYGGEPEALSRDPAVVQAYKNDPLACPYNTLQQGDEVLKALDRLPELCKRIKIPTVIFHGTSDRVVLAQGSPVLFEALASRDRELHFLPGVYHEPHLDLEKEKYFAMLTRWIHSKTPTEKTGRATPISEAHFVSDAHSA